MRTVLSFALIVLWGWTGWGDDRPSERRVTLEQKTSLKTQRDLAVEDLGIQLPSGTIVLLAEESQSTVHQVRGADGKLSFSSTGYTRLKDVAAWPESADNELREKFNKAKSLAGGLFVSSLAVQGGSFASFSPLETSAPEGDFLKLYRADGKPGFTYTKGLTKRFGSSLNKHAEADEAKLEKSRRIMEQLRLAVDREDPAPRRLLMIDTAEAKRRSISFEKTKTVSLEGAWSVAVLGTAVRHGFSNVPCAEFVSEVVRQAYARAGFSHFEDFNAEKGNILDMFHDAYAVATLSRDLYKAGWVPWEASKFIAPTGAPMMHMTGLTPGHAYLVAGAGGRFIVDNGMPQGRDLGKTSAKLLEIMYRNGVFFLPPGIRPEPWPASPAE